MSKKRIKKRSASRARILSSLREKRRKEQDASRLRRDEEVERARQQARDASARHRARIDALIEEREEALGRTLDYKERLEVEREYTRDRARAFMVAGTLLGSVKPR